jgi:hypothetical protein
VSTPLHHHPSDGTFRQDCSRCRIEQAAPDLLAACRAAQLQLNAIRQAVFDNQPVSNGWFETALDRLEAAIQKATTLTHQKRKEKHEKTDR